MINAFNMSPMSLVYMMEECQVESQDVMSHTGVPQMKIDGYVAGEAELSFYDRSRITKYLRNVLRERKL